LIADAGCGGGCRAAATRRRYLPHHALAPSPRSGSSLLSWRLSPLSLSLAARRKRRRGRGRGRGRRTRMRICDVTKR
jgi:hypothetical protein